jgi:hypothetical protein
MRASGRSVCRASARRKKRRLHAARPSRRSPPRPRLVWRDKDAGQDATDHSGDRRDLAELWHPAHGPAWGRGRFVTDRVG